ncbi:MAG: PilZ domain-containing protein [Lysobacter sp.]|nr:PilZ domain-containing protein [Lysobacter sp.]MDQ3268738.1 PilZ domain-containing protein [Pseudomonadota bacterium]
MSDESRRKRRREVADTIEVVDVMTEMVVGRVGNLSENGMLLIASTPLTHDALYQFRFTLPGVERRRCTMEVGAHLLWQDDSSVPGHVWTGFRFITVLEHQLVELRDWLDTPGSRYL